MDVKGVKKRLKDKTFAAGVSREDVADACARAGIDLDTLIQFMIPHQEYITQQYQQRPEHMVMLQAFLQLQLVLMVVSQVLLMLQYLFHRVHI